MDEVVDEVVDKVVDEVEVLERSDIACMAAKRHRDRFITELKEKIVCQKTMSKHLPHKLTRTVAFLAMLPHITIFIIVLFAVFLALVWSVATPSYASSDLSDAESESIGVPPIIVINATRQVEAASAPESSSGPTPIDPWNTLGTVSVHDDWKSGFRGVSWFPERTIGSHHSHHHGGFHGGGDELERIPNVEPYVAPRYPQGYDPSLYADNPLYAAFTHPYRGFSSIQGYQGQYDSPTERIMRRPRDPVGPWEWVGHATGVNASSQTSVFPLFARRRDRYGKFDYRTVVTGPGTTEVPIEISTKSDWLSNGDTLSHPVLGASTVFSVSLYEGYT